MNRIINQKEANELFEVCEYYGVIFYDVQIEIVDHLASYIEQLWEEDPALEFELAKKRAILSFGKSNFTEFASQKEKQVNRKYNRLLWNYLVEFYRWPKLLITIIFTIGFFILLEIVQNTKVVVLSYSSLVLVSFALYLIFIFPKNKITGKHGKTFLLVSRQNQIISLLVFLIQMPNIIHIIFNRLHIQTVENKLALAGLSFFIVSLSILLYANIFFLTKKIKQHFIEQFPEFIK